MMDSRKELGAQPARLARFHFDNIYLHDPKRYGAVTLYQIGDLSCTGGYEIGEHVQYCYELSYIAAGKGIFTCDSAAYEVREGDLVLHRPGQRHNGIADREDPFRYFYIGFTFEEQAEGAAEADVFLHIARMFRQVAAPIVHEQQAISAPFVGLFQELLNLGGYSSLMIEAYVRQLLIAAYRAFYERLAVQYEPKVKSGQAAQIVYRIIHHIDAHLPELGTLTDIAAEMNYSYSYLSHIFSRETGQTIKEYYNRKRFEKASEWLRAGQLSVTQIAQRLHYQSIHSFSKAFRNYCGMSPTEYQALAAHLKK